MAQKALRLRNMWRRTYRPDVATCEREILYAWCDLCSVERKPVPTEERDARQLRIDRISALWRLNDFAVFRQRALKRGAVAP